MHNRAIYNNAIAQLGLIQIYRFPNFSTFQTFAVNLQIFDLPRFTSILEKTMQIADLLFSGINFSTFQLFNFSTFQPFNPSTLQLATRLSFLLAHHSSLISHLSPLISHHPLLIAHSFQSRQEHRCGKSQYIIVQLFNLPVITEDKTL